MSSFKAEILTLLERIADAPTDYANQRRLLRKLEIVAPVPFTEATWNIVTRRIGDAIKEHEQ